MSNIMEETNFKKLMEDVFIPGVERMIEKEQSHLQDLCAKRTDILTRNMFTIFFQPNRTAEVNLLNKYINNSESSLRHLRTRLSEYKESIK